MLPVARFHDPALRIREVILRLGIGLLTGRTGVLAARLFARVPLRCPHGLLGLVLELLSLGQFLGPRFDHFARLLQGGHALFPPRQFRRNIQRFLAFLGLCLLDPLHQLLHFQFQLFDHFARALVTHRRMLARVGLDFRPVDADGAHLRQS